MEVCLLDRPCLYTTLEVYPVLQRGDTGLLLFTLLLCRGELSGGDSLLLLQSPDLFSLGGYGGALLGKLLLERRCLPCGQLEVVPHTLNLSRKYLMMSNYKVSPSNNVPS